MKKKPTAKQELKTLQLLIKRLKTQSIKFCINTHKPCKTACDYLRNRKDLDVTIDEDTIHIEPKKQNETQ